VSQASLREGLGAGNRDHARKVYAAERMFEAYGEVFDA
jgi:hypothetical protein